jgi:hypothetical protein
MKILKIGTITVNCNVALTEFWDTGVFEKTEVDGCF